MDIIEKRYLEWQAHGLVGAMSESEKSDAFYKELEFGTGGLRGKIGEGTNRMNFSSVGRATHGLADSMLKASENPLVLIAYDSRKYSYEFAHHSAEIFSSKGVRCAMFKELMPTPVLSYAVRALGADAGIVITASHNPKEYNGYKVYNSKGCQITDDAAVKITEEISKYGYFTKHTPNSKLIYYIDDALLCGFIDEVMKKSVNKTDRACMPSIVYTPLNGTGRVPVKLIFEKLGFDSVSIVKEQEMPDSDFTTCPYPNPEEDKALTLAYKLAEEKNAELILATDPDADRLGVAERDKNGNIRRFSGNEVGLILLEYILSSKKKEGTLPENAFVVKTIVTSDIGRKIANKYGVKCIDVLTGFKYIGETIDRLADEEFVFGFEESCGYLIGDYARDKDSVGAVMLLSEAAAYYKSKGLSLANVVDGIYEEYGYTVTLLLSKQFEGADGAAEKQNLLQNIRQNQYKSADGKEIKIFKDYLSGIDGLPKSDVMEFSGDGFKFIIRPSGTEPKLKVYFFADGRTKEEAEENLKRIREDIALV